MQNGFVTQAVRERSGIDLLTNVHMIPPKTRQERLKVPITVRGTRDSRVIDDIKPAISYCKRDMILHFRMQNFECGYKV